MRSISWAPAALQDVRMVPVESASAPVHAPGNITAGQVCRLNSACATPVLAWEMRGNFCTALALNLARAAVAACWPKASGFYLVKDFDMCGMLKPFFPLQPTTAASAEQQTLKKHSRIIVRLNRPVIKKRSKVCPV